MFRHTIANRATFLAITALLAASPSPASAAPITAMFMKGSVMFNKANNMVPDATSFDLVLTNVGKFDVSVTGDKTFNKVTTMIQGKDLVVTFSGGTLTDGQVLNFGIQATAAGLAAKVKFAPQSMIWLNGATTLNTNETKITGAKLQGDPVYSVTDDLAPTAPISVQNLTLFQNHAPIPFDSLDPMVPVDTTGGTPEGNFTLTGSNPSNDITVSPILPGDYLYAQGQILDSTTGSVTGAFIDGFATSVPEPSSLQLIVIAGVILSSGVGLRRAFPGRLRVTRGWSAVRRGS
jgi:hypothetical protein